MKTKYLFIGLILLISTITNAQIKIYTGGNVSLGSTTAPPSGFKLQLIGNSVFSANTGSITSSAYIRGLNGYSTATTPDYTWCGNDQTGLFHPQGNNIGFSVGGTEAMRIHSDASISIGRNYSNNSVLYVYSNRNGGGSNSSSPIYSETSHTVDYGWNIVAKVNRNTTKSFIVVDNNNNHNFWVYGNGDAYTRNVLLTSDERLKENIFDFNDVTNLRSLKAKTYNFKNDLTTEKRKEYGFLAQDVQKIFPELVHEDDNGMLSINYIALIPMMV